MLCYFLLFVGLSAFMGGLDHGFFEPINQRYLTRTLTYVCIAAATLFLFRYTILTYFTGKISQVLLVIGYIQFIVFASTSFMYNDFMLVVCNYAPVLLFFFTMNLLNLKRSKSEIKFTMFCVIMIIATVVQILGIGISESVNGDTLFHIIALISYLFFFSGAKKISTGSTHVSKT